MVDYEKAKHMATEPDVAGRRRLAERSDLQPEILYYLAKDPAAEVRLAVAGNLATPRQADAILARDREPTVRERLAHKIARLAPNLSEAEQANIRDLTYEVIAILAADRTVRIRGIIAEAVKNIADAPPALIQRLARDVEIEVAGPILESSPLLEDDELIDIIRSRPIQGALAAIARRRRLGARLSDCLVTAAISASDGAIAVATLLRNHDAVIETETLDRIMELAPGRVEWHEPIVTRPTLPIGTLRRLAGFISHALFTALQRHGDVDPEAARQIAQAVKWRLAAEGREDAALPEAAEIIPDSPLPAGEAAIAKALADGRQIAVAGALARDSGFPEAVVRRVLTKADPKAVLALAWKAGYSAAFAVALQTDCARIPSAEVLKPAEGNSYPLPESELEWQLDLIQPPSSRISRQMGRLTSTSS
jgi:uncharacterized protein (DUF2336 family)